MNLRGRILISYGINKWWKFNYKSPDSGYEDYYIGEIIEEDDTHLKIHTIKSEIRIIIKNRIVAAKITEPRERGVYTNE